MMNDALMSTLRKLRLSGLSRSLDVRLQEAAGHHLTHAEFLELILQDELAVRADRQVSRYLKAAAFRDQRTLEDFDWPPARSSARPGTCCSWGRRAWARATWSRPSARR
jgi:DNA replication protein DnaC